MHPGGFIGPNTCNRQQENMVFNCLVSFNGTSPHLLWRSLNDNQLLNSSFCEDKPNRRNCSLILKSDPKYDGSNFICQTTASIDSSFNCSIEAIKILCKLIKYFHRNILYAALHRITWYHHLLAVPAEGPCVASEPWPRRMEWRLSVLRGVLLLFRFVTNTTCPYTPFRGGVGYLMHCA